MNGIGPTGDFPMGKLGKGDKGETRVALAVTATSPRRILLLLGEPTAWLGVDAKGARDLARNLLELADELEIDELNDAAARAGKGA